MNSAISPNQFFRAWLSVCGRRVHELLANWDAAKLTSLMLNRSDDVATDVAHELGLKVYGNYYCLDAIFFDEGDLLQNRPAGETWVQNIRVAFEHENYFTSGLFKEVSHLLITRADLRVLVTYPEGNDVGPELERLATIVRNSNIGDAANLLIIFGRRSPEEASGSWTDIVWEAREFVDDGWALLEPNKL